MKKVAIITRHAIANYGSLLQAIALQEKIVELGCTAEIIDFIRKDESIGRNTITEAKTKDKWNKNIFSIMAYCLMRMPMEMLSDYKFSKYRKHYLKMSRRISSAEELKKNKPFADLYMTGSDQVWGPIMAGNYEWSYFLDFCSDNEKKVSFAASFGKKEMPPSVRNHAIQLLKRYAALAVREDSAVEFLKEYSIEAKQVLDPTLLLTPFEWENLLNVPDRIVSERYAVVYQIHNNKELEKYALQFAEKAGVKLIRISPLLHQFNRGGKFVWAPTLGEFVSYIKYADYLITDSFHGTVFSINFNTPLVTLMPQTGTSTRNRSILKLLNLENRIVTDSDRFDLVGKQVDFSYTNEVLEKERKKSIDILQKILTL